MHKSGGAKSWMNQINLEPESEKRRERVHTLCKKVEQNNSQECGKLSNLARRKQNMQVRLVR